MTTLKLKTYTAILNIGLKKRYTNDYFSKEEYVKYLQSLQSELISKENIHLSAAVSEYDLVYGDLLEPHLQIRFVNYPKFPLSEDQLKKHVCEFGTSMMKKFEQNRILIEFPDETLVIEESEEIDSKIYRKNK